MKNLINVKTFFVAILATICFFSCKKDVSPASRNLSSSNISSSNNNVNNSVFSSTTIFSQVNIVADTMGFGAWVVDPNLVNAWGIAAPPNGPIWISDNHTGVSTIYNRANGATLRPPVTIPAALSWQTGAPTGVVFNSTTDFRGSKFIFAGEDGIIAAWSGGNTAVKVADQSSSNAVYKGIAMANDHGANFLYVANFKGGKVDVFNREFNYVTNKPFWDPTIPSGFAPFNIVNIGGQLYVTYAKQKGPDFMDDEAGTGNGYVDIFNPDGTFVKRFVSKGELNSPWGVALAPPGFAATVQTILIGNFGSGRINVYDMMGNFMGQLKSHGKSITIWGLWAIDFLKNNVPGGNATDPLYFTAGPGDESHGLFGYLQKH
jgi:uncharacterized protein (TIGR03118 family)